MFKGVIIMICAMSFFTGNMYETVWYAHVTNGFKKYPY